MGAGEVLVGIGAARYLDADIVLDLADLHPGQHGALQIALRIEGDVITQADPRVGLMHRSTEKLFEARDYRQLMMLANRHDWLSSFTSELAIALVIESAMGITPPERATWSRLLLAEMNRLSASLLLIGAILPAGNDAIRLRARLSELQESATGGRVHPMINRIGGIAQPLTDSWLSDLPAVLDDLERCIGPLGASVALVNAHLAGVARLCYADAVEYGVTGPVGWASGLDMDVRRHAPYLAYGEVPNTVSVATAGDIPARYDVLIGQLAPSVTTMRLAAERLGELGEGPVDVPLPKVVRVPEGVSYGQVEGPLGAIGILLVSAADKTPWRLKLRTPSFSNVQGMARALVGTNIDHLAAAVMSFFLVTGDIDR
jgi:NADH-quinone oxidoreductase subunit D